ncbi:MAG: ABC transporter substrate-binding protein [Bdellovibrionales bacterium]
MYRTQPDAERDLSLRVAFPYDKPASFYEPTRIHLAPEYFFLEYIYSPLVEIKAGELSPAIAESFEWKGDDLHLKIRDDLTSVTGRKITPDDVVFSLKRLILKTGNTHGDFRSLVCGDQPLKSVDDPCAGIIKDGRTVILRAGKKKTFLLPMLAAIDFAIIPREAVNPKTLQIIDYKNTSGPYYVAEDKGGGKITLKANPNHFHYSSEMPQTVYLVPTDPKNMNGSLTAFREGRVDFITSIDSARPEHVIDFSREVSGAKLHTTMNIRSFVLAFSKRGLEELTPEQRILIGRKVKEAFVNGFKDASGYQESFQYFPSFAEGGLSKEEISELEARRVQASGEIPRNLKLVLCRVGDKEKFISMFKDTLAGVKVDTGTPPEFTRYERPEDIPHMFLAGPDTGFLEDIGLISYSLSAGLFGLTKPEREKWLSDYMLVTSKEERLAQLRALHKQVLNEPVIIPLMVAPYVALIREGWALDFPQYYGNNPLWQIRAI